MAHAFFGNSKLLFGTDAPMDTAHGSHFTELAKKSVNDMRISIQEKENIFSNNIVALIPSLQSTIAN